MDNALRFLEKLADDPYLALVAVALLILAVAGTAYLKSYFSEKGKAHASGDSGSRDSLQVPDNPLIGPIWHMMTAGLQKSIVGAATWAVRDGKNYVSTRDIFASQNRIRPDSLDDLFTRFPDGSLPEPVSEDLVPQLDTITPDLRFSGCLQESLGELASDRNVGRSLSARDVFIDIAKHGSGQSVRRLRTHGVDAERIEEIVNQLGWKIIRRDV